jgi:hypothetical protein
VWLAGLDQSVPDVQCPLGRHDDLVTAFTGVTGAADGELVTGHLAVGERHVVVVDGQVERAEHLVAQRSLHGQHCVSTVLVGDLDAVGCGRDQPLDDGRGVGRVRDEEDLELAAEIDDEVVDRAAVVVAAQRVLGLARRDAAEVVGEARVDERGRSGTPDQCLAKMAHVEQSHRVADGRVLSEDTAARVLQWHVPSPELGELRTECDVSVVQG